MEYGLPKNDDFNGDSTFGVGEYHLSIEERWRSSASSAFLNPIRNRDNLMIMTSAMVEKVIFTGNKAVVVQVHASGKGQLVYSSKEVILSAGAI